MTIKQIAQKYTHMPVRGEEENPYPAQEYIDAINALFDEMDIAKRWKSNELKKRALIIDQRDERIAEIEAENARLQRKINFYETPGQEEPDGWCPDHEKRFQIDAREDGDECQICRAEEAERKNATLKAGYDARGKTIEAMQGDIEELHAEVKYWQDQCESLCQLLTKGKNDEGGISG